MDEFVEVAASKKSLASRRLVFGVGINDVDYHVCITVNGKQVMCPFYKKWKHMLERCYSLKYQSKKPTYIGCTVCDEWLMFSNFRLWMKTQDWEGKSLDKDLLVCGNKIYSSELCFFVSRAINNLFTDHAANRGDYPQGVCLSSNKKNYVAFCNVNGKKVYIGCYKSIKEASEKYIDAKKSEVIRVSNLQNDTKVKEALIRYMDTCQSLMA